ncbi:PAS domain-containing sensor histidine kinase [Caldimonas brevitalea]|uniref:Sensory transduction histidine kinase n=1 Tax=Caldimonas brevitalea TaxID=413882 RepID=A0A0G3BND7_9BURK|nr:PAS domain S-box protein [Caldimonas brevitalea]AKJ30964.1 sensory transduction histidine kinase [Caldimonas brevitalea]
MSAQSGEHGTGTPEDAAADSAAAPVLVLDAGGRIVQANAAARAQLRVEEGGAVSSLVGVLGLSALQWVLAQLRQAARHPERPFWPVTGPRVTAVPQQPARLVFGGDGGGHWQLRLEALGAPRSRPVAAPGTPPPSDEGDDQALRELRRMFWHSPFPVVLQDAQYRIVDINQAFIDYSGYSRDELIGLDPMALFHADDRVYHQQLRQQLARDDAHSAELTERRFIDAAGQTRWYRAAHRRVRDADGRVLALAVLHDSTAEHQARERADRSVHELDQWFELTPVGMMLFDEDGQVVRSNPALRQLIGSVPASLAQADPSLQDLLGWYAGGPLAAQPPGGPPLHRHGSLVNGDEELALRAVVRCLEERQGQRRYMVVIEDRTAEDERDMAESQLGALAETAQAGLATFDAGTGRFQFGGRVPSGVGLMSSELKAISRDLVRPDTLPEFDRVQRAVRQGVRADARYAIGHPELGERWLQTRVEPRTLSSGRRSTSVVTLDVTEQHVAQQRGERLLRELTTILESTTTGIAYLRGGMVQRCNRQFERMLGLEPHAAHERPLATLLPRDAATQQALRDAMQVLADDGLYETELEMPAEAGARWCVLSVRRMDSGGPELEAIAVLTDVSRLKAQQAELAALARDRELMFSLSDVGIVFVRDRCVQRASAGFTLLTGYSAEEVIGLDERVLFSDDAEYGRWQAECEGALQRDGRWTGERRLRRKDGSLCWVQVHKRRVQDGAPGLGVIGSYVNIDARRTAEHALAHQVERTRAILDSVLVGIVTVGPGGIEWMNRSARRMFGGDLADFHGQPISLVASDDPDHPFRRSTDQIEEGESNTFECEVLARDGRHFWVVGNAVLTGSSAHGREITYALLDIDSRRQAEQRIAEAQASLTRLIDLAPLAITLRDARTLRILQANPIAAGLIGRPVEALIGTIPEEVYPPGRARAMREDMQTALAAQGVTQRDYTVVLDDAETVWDARYLPLAKPGEPPDQLLLVAANVTEQRAAHEARLEAVIAQRELLVKEVHHRIKNNLQGVAGLLQQIAARKPEMAEAIGEVAGQVQAIAHVYGLQVGAAGMLRLRRVVEAITGSVQKSFDRPITLSIEGVHVDEWALPEAESIPIALTLNELLTNAIKHSEAGTVVCRLRCDAEWVQIEVANPGQLPADFSLARFPGGVSGLGLIRALLPRRSARLTLENSDGGVLSRVHLTPPGVVRQDTV